MKTPAEFYKPCPRTYAGKKVELVYPERMLVRTVSGTGFIKHRSKLIPLTIALAGYPVAIDPQTGPPHEIWFAQRRIGWVNLEDPRPTVEVDPPALVGPEELKEGNKKLSLEPP